MSILLIADDEPDVRRTLADALGEAGHVVREALVCQMDAHAGDGDAVVFTGAGGIARAARLHGSCTRDYVDLSLDLDHLLPAIRSAAHRRATGSTHHERRLQQPSPAGEAIAVSPRTRALFDSVEAIAASEGTVLITGETGVGKEIVAQRIAQISRRRHGPLVPVNCGGLPDSLVDSELFGYRKGAFTGAATDGKGLVEAADGGILFLDEIGDMPLAAQCRLLRFLDSGEVRRIGDTAARRADVRVIAATNRPLHRDVAAGRFRQDLYYRLSARIIDVPPLRERREDIEPLARHFLRRSAPIVGKSLAGFSDEALAALEAHPWPGNVRELRNAVERAATVATPPTITLRDLSSGIASVDAAHDMPADGSPNEELRRLMATLHHYGGNQRRTAAALGVSRATLWRRLKRIPLPPEPSDALALS